MRPHKPWFRPSRNRWYVWIEGKQHNLGPDKAEAARRFHALLAQAPERPGAGSIAALLDAFILYCEEHKAPKTVRWYTDYLQDFLNYLKAAGHAPGSMNPGKLTPKLVRAWVDAKGTAKRARITAVKAAYRWGHGEGWIDANPIAAMRRPPATKREETITIQEMRALLRHCNKPMRELLIASWDTGARPQELKSLKPWHVELEHRRCVIPAREAKGKKKDRVIYLTPRAARIVAKGMDRQFIFVNTRGKQWTASAVRCTFVRLEEKIGRRLTHYVWRHSFANRKLKSGLSPIVVAELLGHSDVSQLAKTYQHVAQDPAHMLAALDAEAAK
jgi:site-specific recombinase XerD